MHHSGTEFYSNVMPVARKGRHGHRTGRMGDQLLPVRGRGLAGRALLFGFSPDAAFADGLAAGFDAGLSFFAGFADFADFADFAADFVLAAGRSSSSSSSSRTLEARSAATRFCVASTLRLR